MANSQDTDRNEHRDQPTTLVIAGANGDVTRRLLLPGLGEVLTLEPGREVTVIGTARSEDPTWSETVRESFASVDAHGPAVERACKTTRYIEGDTTDPEDLNDLLEATEGRVLLYFALPPAVTEKALHALAEVDRPDDLWIALEKPIGTDRESAASLNRAVGRIVPEDRIFRVDHFLGMPAVLDLVGLRLANRILEPLLNRDQVGGIEIVFEETLGLEGRADFYEGTGAIRDMLQSHLLQVMGVLMMNAPAALDDDEIPALIAHVLRHTRPAGTVQETTVAGRYTAGSVDGRELPDYVAEEGVDPELRTETFGQLTVEVDTWRWNGVPVTLRSGKAVGNPRQEIMVHFKPAPHDYDNYGSCAPNTLRMGFENAEITLEINAGGPYDARGLSRLSLTSSTGPQPLSAYGNVIRWLLDGNPAFSVSGTAAEQGWRIVQPAVDAIAAGEVALQDYPAGSSGPRKPIA
ncbi:glucose-6-phosphate dehydrogenase [Kocuria coralli]|uniref:Glucose-6-phosphate dehydrogenase n=1 Tax=Kocuria coralli TaxID=1461025 RepID=A0A5J5KUP6_9MICC|nr:glucose-6-phosphate dehydrogenase [Kocuria coralli]KAA9393294.1 glucose-6-phosphate dehydrogenase [Kocuria coralli]